MPNFLPTPAQFAQIAVLEQAVRDATTDVGVAAAVCALTNYREQIWNGIAQPGHLDEGRGPNRLEQNYLAGSIGYPGAVPPLLPGNPLGAQELGAGGWPSSAVGVVPGPNNH